MFSHAIYADPRPPAKVTASFTVCPVSQTSDPVRGSGAWALGMPRPPPRVAPLQTAVREHVSLSGVPDGACIFGSPAGAAAWAGVGHVHPCADFSLVGFGGSPAPPCSLGRRGELRTDSHEELCVSVLLLRVGAIRGGCLEELEQAR